MSDVQLSDAQVDVLNNDPEVKAARTKYLKASAAAFRAKDPAAIEAAKQLDLEYRQLFQAKLKEVIENPPEPRPSSTVRADLRGTGFGNHA